MRRSFIFLSMLLTSVFSLANADDGYNRISWQTNYDEAVRQSRSTSKPIVMLFTGSDWCTWCIKLEQESLNTAEFAQAAGNKFIFLKLDFPVGKSLPADLVAQNKQLQKRFGVSGFPTIVIIDPNQQVIGTTGYKPGGGRAYAAHLSQLAEEHAAYNQSMQHLNKQSFNGTELKHLYEHAEQCGRCSDANQITKLGVTSDQKHFFLLENYRLLGEQGKIHSEEAKTIRQQLVADDPNNFKLTYYQVALIDFEASTKETNGNVAPEVTIAALVDYIEKFGSKDKENLWRLQMIISQVYFDQDNLPDALRYAKSSYQSAPSAAQPQIATAIKNIQLQMH